jgi:hypothetical protein
VGLFDFIKGGAKPKQDGPSSRSERKLDGLIRTASDKRAQQYDRDEALRKLIEVGTPEAAEGLLKRFAVKVDPSITDEDEKQLAFDGIVAIGTGRRTPSDGSKVADPRRAVVEHVRAYCRSAENLTWALKVLRALESDEEYEGELLALLKEHDTEYTRNVEPKVNLLAALESVKTAGARAVVEGFLQDVNETVRYHAVQTLFEQGDQAALTPLVGLLVEEESMRITNKVAEGLSQHAWSVPEQLRDALRGALRRSYEYALDDEGCVHRT